MRHACTATWPHKTICAAFYYDFVTGEQRNVTLITAPSHLDVTEDIIANAITTAGLGFIRPKALLLLNA
jgi:hypothetical protein